MLLNKHTATDVENFLAKPTHALVIDGKNGSGKLTLATSIASRLLELNSDTLDNYPYLLRIVPSGQSVSIDDIRQAHKFLSLKTTGTKPIRRILIVEQAEKMTIEAQNAFLKILEEPPTDTVALILTAQFIKLLPTIRSRAQRLSIKTVNRQELDDHFASHGHKQEAINSAYYAGNALPGTMTALLLSEDDNPKLKNLELVKKMLGMSTFSRLVFADELLKQKTDLNDFLAALVTICEAALKQTVVKEEYRQAKRWHRSLKLAIEAQQRLGSNPNQKLLLTDLLINL